MCVYRLVNYIYVFQICNSGTRPKHFNIVLQYKILHSHFNIFFVHCEIEIQYLIQYRNCVSFCAPLFCANQYPLLMNASLLPCGGRVLWPVSLKYFDHAQRKTRTFNFQTLFLHWISVKSLYSTIIFSILVVTAVCM